MKFNEFIALEEVLKSEGSNINEFVKETTGEYLFEAGKDEIETGRAGKGLHSPRFVLKRKKLNNNAKKFLQGAKTKVIDKYAPKILGSSKNLITKAAALGEEGKNPQEINKLLAKEAQRAIAQQEKSISKLDAVIDKVEAVYNKRVDDLLKDEKLSEKSKGLLEIYWALLVLQVKQLLDKSLVKYREDMIEQAVGDNPEMEKMLKLMAQGPNWKQRMQEYADDIKKQKAEYEKKKSEEEGEAGEEQPKQFKVGEEYQYTSDTGNTIAIAIEEVKDDGSIVVHNTKNKKKRWGMKKDGEGIKRIGNRIKEAEAEVETEAPVDSSETEA